MYSKLKNLSGTVFLTLCFYVYPLIIQGQIKGRVVDAANGENIDYAIVNILKPDGGPLKNTATENGGRFQFSNITPGNYTVKISFIGYRTRLLEVALDEEKTADLGTIKLEQDNQALEEIVITERKPEVEYDEDKVTFNVAQSIMAEGSTATDLLKNVPMVNIDIDGNASIAGKRSTRIFIDGKPSDYTSSGMADLMSILPSEAIEKIEVITNPPARYSSDGDGIINIVLKKGYQIGLNGTLTFAAGTKGTYNSNGFLAYKKQKLSVQSSFGIRHNENRSGGYSLRHNFFPDTVFYLNQFSNGKTKGIGSNFRTAMDWDISARQNLRMSVNFNSSNNNGSSSSNNHYLDDFMIERRLRLQNNRNNNKFSNYNFNGDYEFKADSNTRLSVGINYNGDRSGRDRFFSRNHFKAIDDSFTQTEQTLQHNYNEADNRGLELKTDFSKSLKSINSTVNLGASALLRNNNNDQLAENFDYTSHQYQLNQDLTNTFLFHENIYSFYGSFRIRTKDRWSLRAGGRAELTEAGFQHSGNNNFQIDPYVNFFPSLGVNKNFKKKYNVGFNYNMRISRPREYALNPLIENSDPTNISFGNPDLKPSFTQQVEMNFSTYGNKWSVSPRISFASTSQIIERIRTTDASGNSQNTYQNLASSRSFNLNVSGNYRPAKRMSFNASTTLSKVNYQSKGNNNVNRSGFNFRSNAGLSMLLPKKIAVEGYLNYYNTVSAQGRDKGYLESSFGARKTLLKNKLNVRLLATDPFSQRNNLIFTEGLNFQTESMSKIYTRNFVLSLSYKFTKMGNNSALLKKG